MTADPAGVKVTPLPRCPGHGHMRWDRHTARWICHGWDGEGCGYTADGPDPATWTDLSPTDTITITGELL